MDNNTLIIIAVVAIAGIVIGAIIGYLLGGKKDSGMEAEKAGAEAKATQLQSQLSEKNVELSRRDDDIKRQQEKLIEAEAAKTKAETELTETRANIVELNDQLESKELERASYRDAHIAAEKKSVELQARNDSILQQLEEQKQFLAEADIKLRDAFASLSSEALRKNNATFLESAKETLEAKVKESATELDARKVAIETLVKPLGESLKNFDTKLQDIEIKREGAYKGIEAWLEVMKGETEQLNTGTKKLVNALTTSHVRGRYGEIALRRLVEAAGMLDKCHFAEQESVATETGRLRPDMTIFLPGEKTLIVDSKVPMAAYNRVFETEDAAEQKKHLKDHALAVRTHVEQLSDKSYWNQFEQAPDFVIMYLEFESCYGAALMHDSEILYEAMNNGIVFATPSTFLGLLRTVNYMWQQVRLADGILEMRDAGVELYKRTNTMLEHFSRIGSGLNSAVSAYNAALGSMESRVITHLEKIKDIGGSSTQKEIPSLKPVETAVREVTKQIASSEQSFEAQE
ncbi:MAG: DNA recombination protein RmuC [Acidobacteria bacterium]|nr:DNA recombination protein RmuC [Acidobacteriota bacterium]MCW5948911.1 DNA recombination protein RmuC [Pyrinomonadaceae bacterium]